MESKKVFNFSAGPCVLPKEVLKKAQEEMLDWHGSGLSVMEMSHRGKYFVEISETTKSNLRKLLSIPDDFVIFMFQGGASQQFSAIPQNLCGDEECSTNYLTTGTWSETAIAEVKKYQQVNEVTNNKGLKFQNVADPKEWNIKEGAKYFHYCDNETIQGFEFNDFPYEMVPKDQLLVCDMSSNFCSKPIDWTKFDVVYAGAQKNVGPAGVCFVIVKSAHCQKLPKKDTPLVNSWNVYSKAPQTFQNTPCTWSIYMAGLNIAHMLEQGGITEMQAQAEKRSSTLYNYIDNSDGYYSNGVEPKYRSRMNIPFRVKSNDDLEKKFISQATAVSLLDLSGHRSVGGCRASLYNAMTMEGVEALMAFMTKFRNENSE